MGYRANAQAKANKLNLSGFVKNQHDGSVYIRVEGNEAQLNEFIEWCYIGPRLAKVSEVNVEAKEVEGYQTFELKR